MSSYRTAFTNHLAISNAANRIRKSPNEKVDKLQKSMEKRFSFFLENRDWEQALRILMLNLQSNKNASIEKRASKSVVTPDHFQRLLQFDIMTIRTSSSSSSSPVNSSPSSSSPTALAFFIRDQALSDDIPNSPQLYSAIVHNFCQAHRNPKEALEVAIEGHARWRFDEEEKKEMGMTILRQCAKQKNCWSIACEVVDTLLSSSSSSSSSSTLRKSSSLTSLGGNKVIINNLLGEAAFRSGMWKSVVGDAPRGQNHSTTSSSTELDEVEATEEMQVKEEEEDESKIINLWKACFSAAKERQTEVALSIFEDQILPAASSNGSSNNTDERNISTNALHQLLNCLGAEGNWRKATSVMKTWITTLKRSEITPTASNLFFSSFPSPFINIDIEEISTTNNNNNNNNNSSSAAITAIEAFETATSTFHEWMAQETELFTPPPLTCALMVGFWHQLYFLKKNQKKNTTRENVSTTLDDQPPDFVENAICLLKRFTVDEIIRETRGNHSFLGKGSKNYQHPTLAQIDEASYNALQQARSILLSHEEYQPFLLLRHDENDENGLSSSSSSSSTFLQFPSPSYDRILHHKELFAHRAKQWKQRREEMAQGTRSPFSRPSRQDYFPAFGSDSNLGLNDVVDDENDLRRAMEAGRAIGQHSYDGADVTSQREGSVSSGREGVYSMQSDKKKKDAGSLFEDPRPGPFGQNEKLNGWEYYKMGGQVIYPGSKTSKVASPMHSLAPRRMKNLKKPDRTWSQSTPRAMSKSISKNYKWGKSI